MAVQNGNSTFNIGRDCQIVVQGPGGTISLPNLLSFATKESVTTINKTLLNGQPLNAKIPKEWTGTIVVERGSGDLDRMIATAEAAFRTTGTLASYTIFQYIVETNGSTSTFRFDGAQFDLDHGDWKGDATIEQKIMFTANTRVPV